MIYKYRNNTCRNMNLHKNKEITAVSRTDSSYCVITVLIVFILIFTIQHPALVTLVKEIMRFITVKRLIFFSTKIYFVNLNYWVY